MTIQKAHFETLSVHAGNPGEDSTGAIMTPIYTTSIYRQETPGEYKAFEYSRCGNPSRLKYENAVAELENGKAAFAFASGMAAINSVADILDVNSHIIAFDAIYGGTYRLFEEVKKKTSGLSVTYLDFNDLDQLENSVQENTRIVWIESPSNPLLKVLDIGEISKFCKKHNLLLAVDNTFASPYNQTPISLGADIVVHSASKYINGHSDVIGGIVVVKDDPELIEKIKFIQISGGAVAGPFDSFLAARGLKTLALRMKQHNENALRLAKWLNKHDLVKEVNYPGLESSPTHEIAKKQMKGFGGIISLELNGDINTAKRFLESLKLFFITVSVGGVESLSSIPALMSHSSMPREARLKYGITDTLVRLSIGIESPEDLINDLDQALEKARGELAWNW
ncbi:trans-sulfuration enzyme family protein [Pseudofrancisella aestuarii]|uniref:Trans-sulfuration enzyme family protein n=1 Tax=Pseudofrancisella aestuarii TaxID=2670347 RepID=A0ABV9TCM9_9GAMM|nr:PLP-dependent aspartate aminotransferase family protein [Pseudofrancisella aestuarii]